MATGIAHPWATRATTLRALPRFAYQPPLATPVLGPRIIRHVVSRLVHPTVRRAPTVSRSARRPRAACTATSSCTRPAACASRACTVPARLLQGTRDALGTALALGLERHGDEARTELLDGCGHIVPEERPAEVAAAVRALL